MREQPTGRRRPRRSSWPGWGPGRIALLCLTGLTLAFAQASRAHDSDPDPGHPCDEGPFGVPGLALPPDEIGAWGPVVEWPIQATHASLLSSGKVLIWRHGSEAYLWDPSDDTLEPKPTESEVFCAGHGTLADGRVIVLGGSVVDSPAIPDLNTFDPVAEEWVPVEPMGVSRWYPTATTLPDGRVLATSGKVTGYPDHVFAEIPEVYDSSRARDPR